MNELAYESETFKKGTPLPKKEKSKLREARKSSPIANPAPLEPTSTAQIKISTAGSEFQPQDVFKRVASAEQKVRTPLRNMDINPQGATIEIAADKAKQFFAQMKRTMKGAVIELIGAPQEKPPVLPGTRQSVQIITQKMANLASKAR